MPVPAKKPKEKPKTAKELVYSEVREWIVNGVLKPDEKISDQEISQYFSVSRTPVREAIQMLADQRLVTISPGKETRVSPLDIREADFDYRIAAELHALALEFAYPSVTEDVLDELKKINQSFAIVIKDHDIEGATRFDDQFHAVFLRLAGAHFLTEFTHILKGHLQRIENVYYREHDIASYDSHEKMIEALERHDLEQAKEAIGLAVDSAEELALNELEQMLPPSPYTFDVYA